MNLMSGGFRRDLITYVSAIVIGLMAIVIPTFVLDLKGSTHPYYPFIIDGIDGYSPLTILLLIIGGCVLGIYNPGRSWLAGFATMAAFPVITFIDVAHGWEQHQLWPFEMLMYGILAIPSVIGAVLGSRLRRRLGSTEDEIGKHDGFS